VNQNVKNLLLFLVVVVIVVVLWNLGTSRAGVEELPFSEFLDRLQKNQVAEVMIRGNEILWRAADSAPRTGLSSRPYEFMTYSPGYDDLVKVLREHDVKIKAKEPSQGSLWTAILTWWLPVLALVVLWYVFYRQMQSGGSKAMAFGKSRARLLSASQKRVTFRDVAGADEAKEELKEIIEFLRDPQRFTKLGGKTPRACC
jgi:cell division protease FtsH